MIGGHELDRRLPQDADAVELTAVGEHLGEAQVVGCGRDQTAPSRQERRHLPVAAALRIVDQRQTLVRRPCVAGRQPVDLLFRDHEPGVGHADPVEQLRLQVIVEPLARDDLDQSCADVGRHRIEPARAGVEPQRAVRQPVDQRRERLARLPRRQDGRRSAFVDVDDG